MVTAPTRLHIDWTRCQGRGLCSELLPRILDRDDWGYPLSRDRTREPAVPRPALPDARRAVARCPRLALSLITEKPHPSAARLSAGEPTSAGR
ncbi:ferredoxin [Mycolicibacterium sp. 120266]|uniref:ferredoxin n=1 Tax=Mycolicibacterium sp. 120266 TaxID=3090601 RepID=UPI00299D4136|nr:ferredoxin [Mycolicibacterium sp. 120266]MDX1872503.1 ferredoxin [Mycolicibacterium sp. 120266]